MSAFPPRSFMDERNYRMNKIRFGLLVAAFWTTALFLTGCDMNTMQPQDREFVAKIKKHLVRAGDEIKVSDIHKGDWEKVCFTAAGASYDAVDAVAELAKVPRSAVQGMNRPLSEMRHGDDFDWGIYFFYAPDKIEYFEISLSVMEPSGVPEGDGCAGRQQAYFVAREVVSGEKHSGGFLRLVLKEAQERP